MRQRSFSNHCRTKPAELRNYPSVTLTRVFQDSQRFSLDSQLRGYLWTRNCVATFGLAIAWLPSDSQLSYFRFQIPHFRFQISDFGFQLLDFRFQISSFRFQIPGSRFQISGFGFQISEFRFQISDFRFQISDSDSRFQI